MDKIPVEIVSIIFDYVGYPQLTQCVCRAWREIAGPTARYTIDLMQCAVKDGYLEVLKWGYKQGCYIPQNIWCWCVMFNCTTELIEWLSIIRRPPLMNMAQMSRAVIADNANVVKWFIERDGIERFNIFSVCGYFGPRLTELLMEKKIYPDATIQMSCESIMKHAPLDVIMEIASDYIDWPNGTAADAAKFDRFDVLEWMIGIGVEVGDRLIRAAMCGSIDMFKWVVSRSVSLQPEKMFTEYPIHSLICSRVCVIEKLEYIEQLGGKIPKINNPSHIVTQSLAVTKWFVERSLITLTNQDLANATLDNNRDVVEWMHATHPHIFTLCYVENLGWLTADIELIKMVGVVRPTRHGAISGSLALLYSESRIDVLEWLFSVEPEYIKLITPHNAYSGSPLLLKWMIDRGYVDPTIPYVDSKLNATAMFARGLRPLLT